MPETNNRKAGAPSPAGISVIIPVYNTAPYLRDCLDSICGQTYKQPEIICVNDGSTDNSGDILKEYAARDSRIAVIEQKNAGAGIARDEGLRRATGKYVYYMDSDDTLDPRALEYLFGEAEKNSLDILYFDGDAFFETEELERAFPDYKAYYARKNGYETTQSGPELFAAMQEHGEYRSSACLQLLRRQFLLDNRLLFHTSALYEDELFSLSCILRAQRVSHRQKAFFHRRVRANSIMTSEVNFRSFYGRFCSFWSMHGFLTGKKYGERVETALAAALRERWRGMIYKYESLTPEEREKINGMAPLERETFDRFVLPHVENKNAQGAAAELEAVYKSLSYRVGRLVTWPPRKLRDALRRIPRK